MFSELGFRIIATGNTCKAIQAAGIEAERINKLYEGRPNILDAITNGEIDLIINTPVDKTSVHDDSYLRKAAIKGQGAVHHNNSSCNCNSSRTQDSEKHRVRQCQVAAAASQ